MDMHDILIAKKMCCCEGGGGGGDSDFSTAEITVIYSATTTGDSLTLYNIFYDGVIDTLYEVNTPGMVPSPPNNKLTMVLYKNEMFIEDEDGVITDTDGNITFDSDNSEYIITGDCTITVKSYQFI